MKKRLLITVLLTAGASLVMSGQSGINSTVTVERSYEGDIVSVTKPLLDIPVEDTLLDFKLNFDYTTFYSPYKDLYEFAPLQSPTPSPAGRAVYPWFYARLAAAYPLAPSADVYVTPRFRNGRFSLGFYFNHDSYWGQVPRSSYAGDKVICSGEKTDGDRMDNRGGVFMGYRWAKGELGLDASYTGSRYALVPQEESFGSTVYNEFDRLNASLGIRSMNPDPSSFYYRAGLGYRYFNNRRGVSEHLADVDVSLGAVIREEHRIYVTLGGTFTEVAWGNAFQSRGVWKASPVYAWSRDRWRIRAGLTFSSVYGDCVRRSGGGFLVYPDASVSYEAARNALWLYLKASGDNKLYARYDLFSLNPWMEDSGRAYQSAVPVSVEFGLNGLVRDRFSYSLGINYSLINNGLSFMALSYNYSWYQMANWADSHMLGITGMLKWQSPSFLAQAEFNYRGFSNWKAALMTPAFDVDAVVEYNLRHRLFIRADCYFRTS
ncbi:MAG TPA: hypothetical protein IAC03_03660, partial [Candidatus Coprenecus pullistercoris]|nr:hypothetical protein [Candidatus Coprenecus pullistercoris]